MSEVLQFKTESKRLLELMINSIYSNKEIFLRELISNASDAIDKYHYLSLTEDVLPKDNNYEINLTIDANNKILKIEDNGIGMTHDELINSLGTIAKSGSLEFLEKMKEKNQDVDIIGQFGVGFYSAYMVAKSIEVRTRSLYDKTGYMFKSNGTESYEISEIEKNNTGTEITLYLNEDDDDFKYSDFLSEWKIKELVKKYSDYVRYPIKMEVSKSVPKKDKKDEYEDVKEIETLNSITPVWKKNKKEVTDEELNEFYKQKYFDYEDPLMNIFVNVEGLMEYTALIYIPKHAPYNLYSEKYEKGLQLYSKGIFIMDKCKELVPDYLRFVRGLVDSSDISLNISREILQKSRQLKDIASNVEKKVLSKLENLLKNEFDKYLEFYKVFGVNLKFGIYDEFGAKKDLLKDLILYNTINQEKMITFKEYVENMKEGQEFIYFASGKTKEAVLAMPQMDMIKKQGYDVLVLSDDVDEFVLNIMGEYEGKKFKAINQGDLDLLSKEEQENIKELNKQKKPLLKKIKESLNDKVKDVVLSKRLTDSAVCLVSEDGISFEMEKVMAAGPNEEKPKATRILEINPNHELFKALEKVYVDNPNDLNEYADLLYTQALLIEGLNIENPVEFSKKMCDLMIKSVK